MRPDGEAILDLLLVHPKIKIPPPTTQDSVDKTILRSARQAKIDLHARQQALLKSSHAD